MIRYLVSAAALALAACGTEGDGGENNAAAAANLVETLPNELADEGISDANLANSEEAEPAPPPAASPPAAQPAPKGAPSAEPRRPAPAKAPVPTKAETEPDPHAGHDSNDM